jgi:hypothetical protein
MTSQIQSLNLNELDVETTTATIAGAGIYIRRVLVSGDRRRNVAAE